MSQAQPPLSDEKAIALHGELFELCAKYGVPRSAIWIPCIDEDGIIGGLMAFGDTDAAAFLKEAIKHFLGHPPHAETLILAPGFGPKEKP